ncbi:MAG: D-alanyl-D-alanine carboxypeptidase family protein [Oscillospiraceae bacterium]
MKRHIAVLLLLAAVFAAFPVSALADGDAPNTSAEAVVLIEAKTGKVLFEKNADEHMLIASTTKIMTALVVLENCDVDEELQILPEYTAVEGSSMYLKAGETLTVRDLLYGLLLASGNDAAVALACHTAGSVSKFAAMMNKKAAELGLKNTSFKNPNGLDEEGHYSSASDMGVIMSAAMENEEFAEIAGTKTAVVGERTFTNHNKLLWDCPDVVAGKTGYTKSAGRTLVSCAERDGMRLICVTLSDPCDWADHAALYEWGFSTSKLESTADSEEDYAIIPVISGTAASVAVRPAKTLTFTLKSGETFSSRAYLPRFVYADVLCGERAGYVVYSINGENIAVVDLLYTDTVQRDESLKLTLFERITRLFD